MSDHAVIAALAEEAQILGNSVRRLALQEGVAVMIENGDVSEIDWHVGCVRSAE